MNIMIIDFAVILKDMQPANVNTKTFEIYYDISRMLEIEISKEACFRLYIKHSDNYGKLKDYLCIMGHNPDKKKFDEEFLRRIKQVYFNQDQEFLDEIKKVYQVIVTNYATKDIIAITAAGYHPEFVKMILSYLDIGEHISSLKLSEYLNDYPSHIDEILIEDIIPEHPPEHIMFILSDVQDDRRQFIQSQERYATLPIIFRDRHMLQGEIDYKDIVS